MKRCQLGDARCSTARLIVSAVITKEAELEHVAPRLKLAGMRVIPDVRTDE